MTGKQARLSWWWRDDRKLYWASGCRGGYVVTLTNGCWAVDHRRGPRGSKRRQVGTASSVEGAKAIAERDFARVREAEAVS